MAIYKVYLFRHGKTTYNEKGIFTGHLDAKLAPEGIREAKKIAGILKNKKFQAAFQTRLSRSRQTLSYVLKFHPECKRVLTDNRIIERDYGKLDGISHEEFIKKIGNWEYDLLKQGDAIENLSLAFRKKAEKILGEEEYKTIHRGYNVAPPGGESFADVEKRVAGFIRYLKKFIKKNKVNVAISAHGNSIRIFRKIMEHATKEETVKWFIPYDKVFEYDVRA